MSIEKPNLKSVLAWMRLLDDYAKDWDSTFDNKPHYYTQDFWYLMVSCCLAYWEGRPLSVATACQHMKSGSNRTREERIKKAVIDGYLQKLPSETDGREIFVAPTEKLEDALYQHFSRTLKQAEDNFVPNLKD